MNILQCNFCHEGMNELHVPFPLLYFIHYKEKPQLDFLHPYMYKPFACQVGYELSHFSNCSWQPLQIMCVANFLHWKAFGSNF